MKERPILFSAPMVRALLAGRKTQTRRLPKVPPPSWATEVAEPMVSNFQALIGNHPRTECESPSCAHIPGDGIFTIKSPYGVPGDRLWVKETWRPIPSHGCGYPGGVCDCGDVIVRYAADGFERYVYDGQQGEDWEWPQAANKGNVSPLFMPRWASRITLEVTDVRVQRLQDISEADAESEGAPLCDEVTGRSSLDDSRGSYRLGFQALWDQINGKRAPWASNPWIWAITFKVCDASDLFRF